VNAVAPFVLNARLKPLMEATPGRAKHVVNVSAVERGPDQVEPAPGRAGAIDFLPALKDGDS